MGAINHTRRDLVVGEPGFDRSNRDFLKAFGGRRVLSSELPVNGLEVPPDGERIRAEISRGSKDEEFPSGVTLK